MSEEWVEIFNKKYERDNVYEIKLKNKYLIEIPKIFFEELTCGFNKIIYNEIFDKYKFSFKVQDLLKNKWKNVNNEVKTELEKNMLKMSKFFPYEIWTFDISLKSEEKTWIELIETIKKDLFKILTTNAILKNKKKMCSF